jgi:regulator of sigma E protease
MFGFGIFAGIVVLGALIFIHELGHFLVAKWLGVGVLKFSLGFGRKLIGRKWGETEYQLALVPLGGYVKLLGESPDEPVPKSEVHRSFTRQPVRRRTAIVVAGPMMNLLLTLLVWPLVFMVGIQQAGYLSSKPIIGWVEPSSPAAEAGLLAGDRLISINGETLKDWESLTAMVLTSPNEELTVTLERNGQVMSKKLVSQSDPNTGAGHIGIEPAIPKMVIAQVIEGKAAQQGGLRQGDIIQSINGEPDQDYLEMLKIIKESAGTELTCQVRRGDETLSIHITPIYNPEKESGEVGVSFVPGFVGMDVVTKRYGFLAAFKKGSQEVVRWTRLTFSILGKLITGRFSIRHLGGPITIVRFAGQAAQSGIIALLQFVAILSLQLSILNVLPIPVLDGGHLAFLVIETVIGKPVSAKKQETAYKIGFAVLIALILIVSYNDLVRIFFRFP